MQNIFFTLLWRDMKKNRGFYATSITGLTIGLTLFILTAVYVLFEFSFDKHHQKSDRIIRLVHNISYQGSGEQSASCPFPAGELLAQQYPELIQNQVRFFNHFNATYNVKHDDVSFHEEELIFADSSLFNIFDFNFIAGSQKSALNAPGKIVLTEKSAKKYFGSTDILNRPLVINNEVTVYVSGVIENIPSNSHFDFQLYASMPTILSRTVTMLEN